ncbi:hypothetical protein F5J12DRAFT_782381 [Pisolithus orientalis]|uniref:uncharacterized protein n=1 Tax=Pisolithus orientalis TaxID=936130 RepID=UPI00222483DB|nr:uncharacterized protein F5J12DRAFT_782381 [Pisolithus orientalis]KAI6008143.1 hypothetical protein F5J12DRAFT_782381 [Pisolithus orientalis]
MDGNFKAEHMHPKDAGRKAWLMDGKGYMVASQPYKEYLSSTKNVVELHANAYISMLDGMWICPGIGLWHVHGHCTECFPQYAPNFIVGAGQVDGEIMETLWSSLNIISPSARCMDTPHWQEVLDFQMNDSNFLKMVRMSMRLKWKLKVAEESYLVVEGRFADLNGNVQPAISQSWGEEAAVALKDQLSMPQAMDIYEVRLQKGFALSGIEAPSAKAIKIDLLAIPQPRHLQGMSHIHGIFDTAKKLFGDRFEDAKLCQSSNLHDPETIALLLPSNVGKDHFEQSGLWYVTIMELQLWQGQANDCLHELQLVLAEKVVIFRTDIHHGSNYHMATHAWGRVANAEAAVQCHATVNCWCCIQMGRLGARLDILEQYKELNDSNLTISMAVSDPNARGHRDNTLPWIWTMDVPRDMATNDWMSECERSNHMEGGGSAVEM